VRKRAATIAFANLSLGLWAMLLSLGEGSTAWALFIWIAALQGVGLGLLAGPGWSDHLLNRTPPHRRVKNALVGFAWSVLSFWVPIFAMFIFGLIMAKTLPDAARPTSSLEGTEPRACFNHGSCFLTQWAVHGWSSGLMHEKSPTFDNAGLLIQYFLMNFRTSNAGERSYDVG